MDYRKKIFILLLSVIGLLGLTAISCNFTAPSGGEQPELTLTAMSGAIIGSATADAAQGDQTMIDLKTAEARATATTKAIQATQAARAANVDVNQYATATVSAPILAELPFYGVNTQIGHVGWMTTTQTLVITGYQQTQMVVAPVTAADFVLSSELTWDTQYGSSGCGFMFRSDGDQNKPDAYMVILTRFASGHAVFTALLDGELANIHDFFPKDNDKSFSALSGSTNRIAIVARGNIIEVYSNTAKIAEIDTTEPPTNINLSAPVKPLQSEGQAAMDKYLVDLEQYQDIKDQMQSQYSLALSNYTKNPAVFTNGFVGLSALSESGRTECRFDNTWLWIIDE